MFFFCLHIVQNIAIVILLNMILFSEEHTYKFVLRYNQYTTAYLHCHLKKIYIQQKFACLHDVFTKCLPGSQEASTLSLQSAMVATARSISCVVSSQLTHTLMLQQYKGYCVKKKQA